MTSRPKLQEVADLAGVSLATASRVLNGRPGVAGGTRKKVLDALATLGYRDRRVGAARSGVVGIVTPELDNPIFPLLAQTIESRLSRAGMLSMVCPATSDTVNEQEYLDHFVDRGAAGVVVINGRYAASGVGYAPYEELVGRSIPVVLVNGVGPDCPVPAVATDIWAGGAMAVRHLASLGHQRIGCLVGPHRYLSTRELLRGHAEEMARAGLAGADDQVCETLFTLEGGRAGAVELVEAGVTGIVCGGDLMALGAVAGLRSWGYRVPEDVSVVGFDGTALVTYTDPPLTSVRQPVYRMAATVATLLLEHAGGSPTVHMFEPDLVIGGSTGPAP